MLTPHLLHRSFSAALLAISLLCAFSATRGAHAQTSMQMVGGPLTTKRLERLLSAYVQPTADEASAIDRLHEVYLDGFRAELDSEIAAIAKSMGRGMPTEQEFKKVLRDSERVQARIGERDNAFLDSAAAILPEERRAGIERIREARERQRELSGLTRVGPMLFGGGGSFVDLPDLLAREAVLKAVTAESRASFDSLLRSQEQRTLTQARNFNRVIRKAYERFFESILAMKDQAAGGDEGDKMAQIIEIQAGIGAEPRKMLAANFHANRVACTELASVLPTRALLDLRCELATKSMGMLGVGVAQSMSGGNADVLGLLSRIERDRAITDETKRSLDNIADAWRTARTEPLETLAATALEMDLREMMGSLGGLSQGDSAATQDANSPAAKLLNSQKRLIAAAQTAYAAISSALGADAQRYVSYAQVQRGNEQSGEWTYREVREKPEARANADPNGNAESSAALPRATIALADLRAAPEPHDARTVERILALYAEPTASSTVMEQTVEAWKTREYEAKVVVIGSELNTLAKSKSAKNAQGGKADPAIAAQTAAVKRRLVEALLAADAALCSDLANALGLTIDDPGLLALRLERVRLLDERAWSGALSGSSFRLVAPSAAVLAAKLPPADARALLVGCAQSWRALIDELTPLCNAVIDRDTAMRGLRASNTDSDEAAREKRLKEQQRLTADSTRAATALRERMDAAFESSCAALGGTPEAQRALRRIWKSLCYPNIFNPSECASTQLAEASQLTGLNEDQLARLDALTAEYDVVYDALSDSIAQKANSAVTGGDSEAWRERQVIAEEVERLRFQRKERTDKARSEARRILGEALASRVRGLLPSDDAPAPTRRTNPREMFASDDD